MIIKLSPQRRDDTLEVVKKGSVIFINGEEYDFSPMPNGATLPREALKSEWFSAPADMVDGVLVVSLFLPNPYNYSQAQAFPIDLVDVPDGAVQFPPPLTPEETAIKFPPRAMAEEEDQETPQEGAEE